MTQSHRLAIIEVGTKGVRLFVAERRDLPLGMQELESRGEQGFLGEHLAANQGRMSRGNIDRSLSHVRRLLDIAGRHRPDRIVLVGTEVFRRATNNEEFTRHLPAELPLRILSPEEEAIGSFLAAGWGFRETFRPGGCLLLLDLGGGSLEIVAGLQGDASLPVACISMRGMGTLALRDVWQKCGDQRDRPERLKSHLQAEIDSRQNHLVDLCQLVGGEPAGDRPVLVAGLGSTVTASAWRIHRRGGTKFSSDKVHGLQVSIEQLHDLREKLASQADGREADTVGAKKRLDLQLGLSAILTVSRSMGISNITACGAGLRFGLAFAFLHDIALVVDTLSQS